MPERQQKQHNNHGVALVGGLLAALAPVLARRGGPHTKQLRNLLAKALPALAARGGGLCLWEGDGRLIASPSRGLSHEAGSHLRRLAQSAPPHLEPWLTRLGYHMLRPGQALDSPWPELKRLLDLAGTQNWRALWPLSWEEGHGLVLWVLGQGPGWSAGLTNALAGCLSLALDNILLQRQAASRSVDYERIFINSQDMIYLSTRDGRWERVNPAGVRMLGYDSEAQLLAVPDSARAAYINPEDRQAFTTAIEKDGFVKDYEVTFKHRDGTPMEVSITSQVRRGQNGEVVGYEGIIKDITHRKWGEAQAARQRWLVEAILEAMPVAVFVVDQDHRVLHWNRACTELTGVPKSQILGTSNTWKVFNRPPGISLADLVVEDDWQQLLRHYSQERLRRSTLSADAWEAQARLEVGGRMRDLFIMAGALREPQGQMVGAVEAILDMTNLKALESQLAESESLYRSLVEAYREGIALHDGRRFVFANRPFLEMFGLASLQEAPGDLLELMAPASRRDYLQWSRDLAGQGVSPLFEGQGTRGETAFDLEMNTAPAHYQGRRAMLFTVRDVTYRKQMEEQLIRSERLAATGKLAFDIAHEVNNPLGGILTYAHLLAEDLGRESPLQATAQKIIALTDRCKVIVRGLLDFARQDTPERQAMDLNQVLREMLSLMEGHVIMHGVRVVQDLEPGLPYFYGQRAKLEQVFLNLLINAAEAMEGQGVLTLTTRLDRPAGHIRVSFQDNGPGMAEDVARRIFDPFFTTKAQGRGTGLGLAISFGIVKQHDGDIEVGTALGQGSCFTVKLPVGGAMLGEKPLAPSARNRGNANHQV
ncbi:MAG: PAS domain S-box protein [Desulfarculus sp.]|nr:PAS domain S-box protein [Desulfarculus sp.]